MTGSRHFKKETQRHREAEDKQNKDRQTEKEMEQMVLDQSVSFAKKVIS